MKLLLSLMMLVFSVNSYAVETADSLLTDLPSETVFTIKNNIRVVPSNLTVPLLLYEVDNDIVFCSFVDKESAPVPEGESRYMYKGTRLVTKGRPRLDFTSPTTLPDTFYVSFALYGYEKSFISCVVRKKMNIKVWALILRINQGVLANIQLPSFETQEQNENQCH